MAISAPMQPSTWNQRSSSRRQCRQSLQIVDCAGVDRAGRSDHAGGPEPRRPILGDRRAQGDQVDPQFGVGRNAPQRPVAQPERLHRLAMTAVEPDPSRRSASGFSMAATPCSRTSTPALALRATVRPMMLAIEPPLTSVPLAEAGKPIISLHQPTTCWSMQGGGMVAAAEVRALDRRQEVPQRPGEVARSHVPGPEARMDVAHRIGHHVLRDLVVDLGQRRRRLRQGGRRRRPSPPAACPARPGARARRADSRRRRRRSGATAPASRSSRQDRGFLRQSTISAADPCQPPCSAVSGGELKPRRRARQGQSPLRSSRPRCRRTAASSCSVRRCREACTGSPIRPAPARRPGAPRRRWRRRRCR